MKPMYLDNAATTSIKSSVKEEIVRAFDYYGNPSSIYSIGQETNAMITNTRSAIANYINCGYNEIIFTASGSEADNMALKGFYFANMDDCTIITSAIEHKAILNSCAFLERIGCKVQYVSVDEYGKINLEELEELCKAVSGALLVSIQFANNEIGTIQNIKTISNIVHKYNGVFHTDAVQAFPEIHIDTREYGIDMMSVSGHKFGTPKGVGFLYKRSEINIEPLIHGGKQEFGMRAGTENIPYISGVRKSIMCLPSEQSLVETKEKRDYFIQSLQEIKGSKINGHLRDRLVNNINVSFEGIEGESLLLLLDMNNIYVSSGSACNSGNSEASYVLKAIGVDDDYINGSVRISIDNNISYDTINHCVKVIKEAVNNLRKFTKEGE